jgi:hypothetical protein
MNKMALSINDTQAHIMCVCVCIATNTQHLVSLSCVLVFIVMRSVVTLNVVMLSIVAPDLDPSTVKQFSRKKIKILSLFFLLQK